MAYSYQYAQINAHSLGYQFNEDFTGETLVYWLLFELANNQYKNSCVP